MIRVLKLITGEEIIGQIDSTNNGVLMLRQPQVLVPQPTPDGAVKVAYMPWATYGEHVNNAVVIYPHAIVSDYQPTQDLEQHYTQTYISQIQVVSSLVGAQL